MELSDVVGVEEEVAGREPEAVVVEEQPPLMRRIIIIMVVKVAVVVEVEVEVVRDLEEARRRARPGSRKLHELFWIEKSKIVRRWHRWQRSPVVTLPVCEATCCMSLLMANFGYGTNCGRERMGALGGAIWRRYSLNRL